MVYLIVGAIIALSGIGLMMNEFRLIGIIIALLGAAIGFKGRRELDKFKDDKGS
jgi:hypothetical protein